MKTICITCKNDCNNAGTTARISWCPQYKPGRILSNADRIRAMSDEEKAKELTMLFYLVRLTYFDNGKWRVKIGDTEYSGETVDRLAAYEDTGLEPEAVEHLKLASMGRAVAEITEFEGIPIDRLRELTQADREGRCVVLPCKVGDTLYDIYEAMGNGTGEIRELKVNDIRIHLDKRSKEWLIAGGYYFSLSDFGKTVFLTREDAEAALRKEQNGQGGRA